MNYTYWIVIALFVFVGVWYSTRSDGMEGGGKKGSACSPDAFWKSIFPWMKCDSGLKCRKIHGIYQCN